MAEALSETNIRREGWWKRNRGRGRVLGDLLNSQRVGYIIVYKYWVLSFQSINIPLDPFANCCIEFKSRFFNNITCVPILRWIFSCAYPQSEQNKQHGHMRGEEEVGLRLEKGPNTADGLWPLKGYQGGKLTMQSPQNLSCFKFCL